MLLIDGHLDLAWNALQWNRDLLSSVHTIRARERSIPGRARGWNTVSLPELQRARICVAFATVLARVTGTAVEHLDYPSKFQAFGICQGQLAYYRSLAREGHTRSILDQSDLEAHVASWKEWESLDVDPALTPPPPVGIVVAMESADAIVSPDHLEEWWLGGVRIIGPAHYGAGRYAGGTCTEMGLTHLGVALLDGMQSLGIILDVTHLSEIGFWQALGRFQGPVLASHNNCRALVPHQRQLNDDQLRAVIQREGVIGVSCDAWMLSRGWSEGVRGESRVTMHTVVDHIDYICQMAGNSDHAAIGSDLDGGFGREQSPSDLDTIADLQMLHGLLADRGYGDADLTAIFNENWLRILRGAWGT